MRPAIQLLVTVFLVTVSQKAIEGFVAQCGLMPKRHIHRPNPVAPRILPVSTRSSPPSYTSLSSAPSDDADESSLEEEEKVSDEEELIEVIDVVPTELGTGTPTTHFQRFRKKYFAKQDDGLTFKQRMAKAGLSVALSYGWVSNVSYSVTVSLAWYIFNKRTGLSPLAPGQWKGFLAIYAGFYVFNNIIRPLRFGLSVGVSVYFDRVIKKIQDVFNVNKGVAIFLTVFLANVVGTCTLMALGISLASMASGVPIFAPKP